MTENSLVQSDFRLEEVDGGSLLFFPSDAPAVAALRLNFSKARWSQSHGAWFLPGVRSMRAAAAWILTFPPSGAEASDPTGPASAPPPSPLSDQSPAPTAPGDPNAPR